MCYCVLSRTITVVTGNVCGITIFVVLQVYNHFNVPVDVYYMTPKGNELELIGAAQPNSHLNIPLKAVYTPTNELFFAVSGHSITSTPYVWKDLRSSLSITKVLQCPHRDAGKGKRPFVMKCVGEIEQVYFEQTSRHTMASTCYNIHLRPSVIFKNFLPIDVVCCVDEQEEEIEVKAGDTLQLPNIDPGRNVLVVRVSRSKWVSQFIACQNWVGNCVKRPRGYLFNCQIPGICQKFVQIDIQKQSVKMISPIFEVSLVTLYMHTFLGYFATGKSINLFGLVLNIA